MLMSRSQWQKWRDNHKESPGKGAVRSVSVGKVLDATSKTANHKDFKKVAAGFKSAQKSFQKYYDGIKGSKPKFAKDFKAQFVDEARKCLESAVAIAKPAEALKANIVKSAALIGGMKPSSTGKDWTELHTSDPVRLIAMNLGMISRNDAKKKPLVDPILGKWKGEMNKILPEKVGDDSAEVWKAVGSLRKAFKQLAGDCKTAGLI